MKSPANVPKITLESTAFAEGQMIPVQFTGQGQDISPPLRWSGVPTEARSLALIADDPDAPMGTWVHWVLYDLPPSIAELPQALAKTQYLPNGAKQGLNDFRSLGYGGPMPPPGKAHRYVFKLYALDTELGLAPGATKHEVEAAMQGHILAEGRLTGRYQRR